VLPIGAFAYQEIDNGDIRLGVNSILIVRPKGLNFGAARPAARIDELLPWRRAEQKSRQAAQRLSVHR
jgi:hypothetical protein